MSRRKHSRRRSRSSGSRSSNTSSSASGLDSLDGKPNRKYLQWDATKHSVKVTSQMLARAEKMRFNRRSDLINFSHKCPGALGALSVMQAGSRLSKGPPAELTDLMSLDTQAWTDGHNGLKELRDLREVRALTQVLMILNQRKLLQAVDVIAQRIREVQAAKRAGRSRERAELVSLPSANGTSVDHAAPTWSVGSVKAAVASRLGGRGQGDP